MTGSANGESKLTSYSILIRLDMPEIVERPLFEAALRNRDFLLVTVPGDEKFPWGY